MKTGLIVLVMNILLGGLILMVVLNDLLAITAPGSQAPFLFLLGGLSVVALLTTLLILSVAIQWRRMKREEEIQRRRP